MIQKKVLNTQRVRGISGSFAFIEHRFLRDGFWISLSHQELLLYVFLVLVADRRGLSYYGYDKICKFLRMDTHDYLTARDGLIGKDLIDYDGTLFQVLSLPAKPSIPRCAQEENGGEHVRIGQLLKKMMGGHT